MNPEELRKLAESFFEWPTEDRTQVTLTSALLFAQHVLRMTQQQAVEPTDQLCFKSACEISGEKHPEYVRGYEAAMDAVCRAREQQAEPVAYGVKSNEESGFIFSLGFSKKLAENQCSLLGGHVVPLYTAPQAQPSTTNKEHDNAKDSD